MCVICQQKVASDNGAVLGLDLTGVRHLDSQVAQLLEHSATDRASNSRFFLSWYLWGIQVALLAVVPCPLCVLMGLVGTSWRREVLT